MVTACTYGIGAAAGSLYTAASVGFWQGTYQGAVIGAVIGGALRGIQASIVAQDREASFWRGSNTLETSQGVEMY